MTSNVGLSHMTADELSQYSHEPYRHELVAGTLHEMEPPGAEHGIVAMRIGTMLSNHVAAANLGLSFAAETGFKLASEPDTVRAPDAAFVARERAQAIGRPRGYWPGPPDLAIEVLSPGEQHSAVEGKALDWLDAGAHAVVVVDPTRHTATIYRSRHDIRVREGDDELGLGDVVPGWTPRVGEFFV